MSDSLPNHENWTYRAGDGRVRRESEPRVLRQQGRARQDRQAAADAEDSAVRTRPRVSRLPSAAAARRVGGSCENPIEKDQGDNKPGVDCRWEHNIVVVNAEGKITEDWNQWDKLFTRAHDVEISPYDPQKSVWVVDAEGHGVYKFSNDGKKLLLQLGTPRVAGDDDSAFQTADVHRLHGCEHRVPGRRLRQHARHQVQT